MKVNKILIMPVFIVFVSLNIIFYLAKMQFVNWGIDISVLLIANSLIFILTLITFFNQQKALLNINPNVFIRSIMSGMMIKMFACMVAILIYWFLAKEKFSRPTVIAGMLMYLVYLAVEVKIVSKLNRQKNA